MNTRPNLALIAGLVFGCVGLAAVSASAAPAFPQAGLTAGDTAEPVAHRRYRSHHDNHFHSPTHRDHVRHYGKTKRERLLRRRSIHR